MPFRTVVAADSRALIGGAVADESSARVAREARKGFPGPGCLSGAFHPEGTAHLQVDLHAIFRAPTSRCTL